jgi:modification methylase scrFIB
MKIRLTTIFSGYDSQALSLERLKRDYPDFDYELVAWCEIDQAAIHAHNALFPQWADRNMGDICKVNPEEIPDCDCITWSFPCQDISSAGKQRGLHQDSGSRSSLAWECMKIFRAKRPKFLLMENVKALTQKKFMPDFIRLQKELEDMGYTNFWQVLNSKDFGIPQNRERVFMVSILKDNAAFEFPKPFPLVKRLRDVLEENVDESYYLKDDQVLRILAHCERKQAEGCGFKAQFIPPPTALAEQSQQCTDNGKQILI